jgi:hypothetical protein
MSGLLYGVGALALVVGAVLIGFGIPINEFSFGNTLIIAGTTTVVGGLIVVGLGVVVAHLRRLAEALAAQAPVPSGRPLEMFDLPAGSRAAPGQVPFPPRPKLDSRIREPHYAELNRGTSTPADMLVDRSAAPSFAPTLRNPYEPPAAGEDEVSLSPQHPMPSVPGPAVTVLDEPARQTPSFDFKEPEIAESRQPAAPMQTREPHKPNAAYFDAMWPAEAKPAKSAAETETRPYVPSGDLQSRDSIAAPARRAEPEAPKPRQVNEPRAVAILKSGVVDGMGYTLYVDGSIEAELPQGTLRFASINELRSHLENNVQ